MGKPDNHGNRAASAEAAAPQFAGLLTIVVCTFLLSRIILHAFGVRFDAGGLTWFWQFLDPELLREDLLRSLYHLHMQPPLFNLALGIVLKACPGHETAAFTVVYHGLGLALVVTLCLLLLRLGVGPRLSLVLTILFMVSPPAVLYENYLFYTYPLATMLVVATLFLHYYLTSGRLRDALVFFVLLAAITLTRSLFHLVWFLAVLVMLLWWAPRVRRTTLVAALPALLAIVGWYLKNLVVFGSFSASTWLGMSMWKTATLTVPPHERNELARRQVLSRLSRYEAFSPLDAYDGLLLPPTTTGVPALDEAVKSSGVPNYNNIQYIEVSKRCRADAVALLKHSPRRRIAAVGDAFFFYFVPASDFNHLNANRTRIAYLERMYDICQGQVLNVPTSEEEQVDMEHTSIRRFLYTGLTLVIVLPLLLIFGCYRAWKGRAAPPTQTADTVTLAFCCLTIAYVTLAGNLVEIGENMRFRFLIDPLFLVLLGLALTDLWQRRGRKRHRLLRSRKT